MRLYSTLRFPTASNAPDRLAPSVSEAEEEEEDEEEEDEAEGARGRGGGEGTGGGGAGWVGGGLGLAFFFNRGGVPTKDPFPLLTQDTLRHGARCTRMGSCIMRFHGERPNHRITHGAGPGVICCRILPTPLAERAKMNIMGAQGAQ